MATKIEQREKREVRSASDGDQNLKQKQKKTDGDEMLYKNLTVKCSLLEGKSDRDDIRVCGTCDACQLQNYVSRTNDWFQKASENTKKIFLCGLARRITSSSLIGYIQQLIQPIACKDYTYSRSRSSPGVVMDEVPFHGDRTLDVDALENEIFETWHWFGETSHYGKMNYMLDLLKLCDSHLLLILRHQMRTVALSSQRGIVQTLLKKIEDNKDPESEFDSDSSDETFVSANHPNLAFLKEVKDPKDYTMDAKNPLTGKTFAKESKNRKQMRLKALNKIKLEEKKAQAQAAKKSKQKVNEKAEECEPTWEPASTVPPYSEAALSGMNKYKDFVRDLPVYLSKYILNFLDKKSLVSCVVVSRIWRAIAGQVIEESDIQMKLQEQYTVLQGSSAKGCNPVYAKDIVCMAPDVDPIDKTPKTVPGCISQPQDFSPAAQFPISFETAYFGYRTRQIYVEERNIYCGSYNTLILAASEDQNRIIHYNGGQLIALASDKKLYLINVEDGKAINKKPITGHAGSIQCAYIEEKEGYVLTGSYDTSARMWEIETGACKKIFRGHTDSIYALTKYLDIMVTGSKDTTVKVWDISKGVVTMSFKHKDSVLCVEVNNDKLFSGDSGGVVKMWDMRSEELIKDLIGHVGPVLCLKSDNWHLASGGKDGNVLIWSTVGKFGRCLGIFRHPTPVMNVHMQDMRVLSGCMDGKMRIWNLLTGDCLRLLRGNSRSEPIYHMWPVGETRIIINTLSNVLALNFERVEFDYTLDEDKPEIMKVRTRRPATVPARATRGSKAEKDAEETGVPNLHYKQSHAYLRAQKMKQKPVQISLRDPLSQYFDSEGNVEASKPKMVGSANSRILYHPVVPGADRRPATSGSIVTSRATSARRVQTTIPRPHTKESRFSEWGSEFMPSNVKPPITAQTEDHVSRTAKSADVRTATERGGSGVPEILAKQLAIAGKQSAKGGKTIDSSEAELATEHDRRRRNSNIGGTIQYNSCNVDLSEALALLRSQKRQNNQRNVTPDQIFLTVNMIKQAIDPNGEVSENTAKNVATPHIFESPKPPIERPSSAPFDIDPRQKAKATEMDMFKPKQDPGPPVDDVYPEPLCQKTATPVIKTTYPQFQSKLIPSKIKSSIPPIVDMRPQTVASQKTISTPETIERPVSTARSAINRKQSPMLMKQKSADSAKTAKRTPVTFQHNMGVFDPFKQYATVDLRTLTEWDEYEKNYQIQYQKEMRQKEMKAEKEKHRRWLQLARANIAN